MASVLASLTSYNSDSDDDAGPSRDAVSSAATVAAAKPASCKLDSLLPSPRAGLASQLPVPSSSSSPSRLSLPPPASSSKRKVIKVESFKSYNGSDDTHDLDRVAESGISSKKPKLGSSIASGSSVKHSLFGMLPAPKRSNDEVLAERNQEAQTKKAAKSMNEIDAPLTEAPEAPLKIHEPAVSAASPDQQDDSAAAANSRPKAKNNDAFRAMLGLKPAANKPDAPAAASSDRASKSSDSTTSTQALTSTSSTEAPLASSQFEPSSSKTEAAASVDFFSLDTARPLNSDAPTSHTPSFCVSSAPVIDQSEGQPSADAVDSTHSASEYPGWQLDHDGLWVPITAEAQAQFVAYQQSLVRSSLASSSKSTPNLDGTRDLLAAGLTPQDIQAFDASTAARQAYLSASGDETDSDKYAAAAEFAAGNRDVPQRKPGMLKGLKKGQLSSIVNLAAENRAQLEQRWKKGREAMARGMNQYGW